MARAAQGRGGGLITVHGFAPSGNCHKLRLLLEQLGERYRWVEVDSSSGETRTAQFLALNPNGKVPVVDFGDGRTLCESNAILYYLADGSAFLPADLWQRAQALSWMNFEQYSHEPCIAVARSIAGWTPLGDSALALWTRPNQAYLLELQGRCQDLDFAQAISVTNQMGSVHRRFDKVIVLGQQSIKIPCFIDRILPLDVKALKQAQKEIRSAGTMPEEPKS